MDVPSAWAGENAALPNRPPSPGCNACGLFVGCKSPVLQPMLDSRRHINGKSPGEFPLVLIVGPKPSPEDDLVGVSLSGGFTADFLKDYLSILEARWVYVPVVRCCPQNGKVGKGQVDACGPYLVQALTHYKPQAILALGKDAFDAVWPNSLGKPPSISRARTMPIRLESGAWLLGGYDPNSHRWFLETDGKKGVDLNQEYPMTFNLLDQLLCGTYQEEAITWSYVETQEELDSLIRGLDQRGISSLDLDIEDKTFCAHDDKWRPYKATSSETLPRCYTMFHEDNDLLVFGIKAITGKRDDGRIEGEIYSINVDLLKGLPDQVNFNVLRLLRGRTLITWNGKYEMNALWLFTGYDIGDPANGNELVDGFIMRFLRDQSLIHNSLKETAQDLLGAKDWSWKLYQDLADAKSRLPWGTASMADLNIHGVRDYNAGDVYYPSRLIYEKILPSENFPQVAYDTLVDCLPFVTAMEREGLPFNMDIAAVIRDSYDREAKKNEEVLKSLPEFQEALVRSGLDAEDWSPRKKLFYDEFLQIWGVKDQVPRTPTGQLSMSVETIYALAGEGDPDTGVGRIPWEQKSYREKVFTAWHRVTRYQDDANKYRYYMDFAVPVGAGPRRPALSKGPYCRIHQSYYIGKVEAENLGQNTGGKTSGAKSGRFSSTPPQNQTNDPIFLLPYEEEPGWLVLEVDFSQAELFWIAWNTQDPLMLEWCREGADLHLRKGANLFCYRTRKPVQEFWAWRSEADCKTMDGVHPEQKPWRQAGKTDNFAQAFLQEPETIAAALGIPVEEAYEIGRAGDEFHPAIKEAKMEVYDRLQRGEMVYSHVLKRQRSCKLWNQSSMDAEAFFSWDPEIRKRRNRQNMDLFRSVWNTVIAQADSSDMTLIQGNIVYKKLRSGKWLDPNAVRPIHFVHDAVRFRVRERYVEVAAREIAAEMVNIRLPIPFDLPIQVSAKAGRSFAKLERIHL